MKKWIAALLAMILLALSAGALAEEAAQQESQSQNQTQTETTDTQKQRNTHQNRQKTKKEKTTETDAVSGATQASENLTDSNEAPSEQKQDKQQKNRQKGNSRYAVIDDLVTQNVISQETADKIKAYIKEHSSNAAAEDSSSKSNGKSEHSRQKGKIQLTEDLLKELLDGEIIGLEEYDAMLVALAAQSE